jgi:hypothetical protein
LFANMDNIEKISIFGPGRVPGVEMGTGEGCCLELVRLAGLAATSLEALGEVPGHGTGCGLSWD